MVVGGGRGLVGWGRARVLRGRLVEVLQAHQRHRGPGPHHQREKVRQPPPTESPPERRALRRQPDAPDGRQVPFPLAGVAVAVPRPLGHQHLPRHEVRQHALDLLQLRLAEEARHHDKSIGAELGLDGVVGQGRAEGNRGGGKVVAHAAQALHHGRSPRPLPPHSPPAHCTDPVQPTTMSHDFQILKWMKVCERPASSIANTLTPERQPRGVDELLSSTRER